MSNRIFLLVFCLAAALAGGCSMPLKPYRMEIQQGNFLTQEQVDKLQTGMTREQVRFLLGTPLLTDVFHADRWDYVYRRQKASSKDLEERRLTLFFADNRLVRTEGDLMPSRQADAGAAAK